MSKILDSIIGKVVFPYDPCLPLAHPPVVMTFRGHASVRLHNILRKELEEIIPLAYDPGNETNDPYSLFDKVNEVACYGEQAELDEAVRILLEGYCNAAEGASNKDEFLKEASDSMDDMLISVREKIAVRKPSLFERFFG